MSQDQQPLIVSSPDSSSPSSSPQQDARPFLKLVYIAIILAGTIVPAAVGYPAAAPYLLMNIITVLVGWYIQDWGINQSRWWSVARWQVAASCVAGVAIYKTLLLVPLFGGQLLPSILFYAITALWECSNAVLVFGGRPLLEKYKITSLKRAMMVALVPCQVKFVHEQKPNLNWHRSGHLVGLLLFGYAVHMGLHHIPGCMDIIRAVVFLEAEVLAIIIASFLLLLDIPGHVWQIELLFQN